MTGESYAYRFIAGYTNDAPSIILRRFTILRDTPAGFVVYADGLERFCLNGAGKRFAHRLRADAWYSFRRRLEREHLHLQRRVGVVKRALEETVGDRAAPNVPDWQFPESGFCCDEIALILGPGARPPHPTLQIFGGR